VQWYPFAIAVKKAYCNVNDASIEFRRTSCGASDLDVALALRFLPLMIRRIARRRSVPFNNEEARRELAATRIIGDEEHCPW
jgi:hypothetical protein